MKIFITYHFTVSGSFDQKTQIFTVVDAINLFYSYIAQTTYAPVFTRSNISRYVPIIQYLRVSNKP